MTDFCFTHKEKEAEIMVLSVVKYMIYHLIGGNETGI